ncbi:unnamed protein product [Lactuca virosa]|uniref:Uncharacterized protein n=1 Tax=Lactuca virosa TaxID=75947 RepID=A0AAU9LZ70_9ASTR|nr:unnamed protein product [Lactuca virosa]
MASTGISHIGTVKSKLTVQTMGMLLRKYHIDPKFHPRLPEANDAITDTPEGFVLCFTLLCVALDVSPSITLFHYFYLPMSNGDWVSFSLRHGLMELCDVLPTSIKYWKEEFFFVHASSFSDPMAYGATADRVADLVPELSPDELLITERLASNFVRWAVPDEAVLGMAGMSPH